MALIFPTPAQAALQTPVNVFSPTSTPLVNIGNDVTYTYLPAKGVWVSSGTDGDNVTCVQTGTGLSGGPITGVGTISIANTTVAAGSYTYACLTVNAQGQLTAAANGCAPVTQCSYNAKGDLLVATANDTYTALPVGANNSVLMADSACLMGVKWAPSCCTPLITTPPASSSSAGTCGQVAINGQFFYWHDGIQWYRTTGSIF